MPVVTETEMTLWSRGLQFVARWYPSCSRLVIETESPAGVVWDAYNQHGELLTAEIIPNMFFARVRYLQVNNKMSYDAAVAAAKLENENAHNLDGLGLAAFIKEKGMTRYEWLRHLVWQEDANG